MLVEAGRIAWSDADPPRMVEVGRRGAAGLDRRPQGHNEQCEALAADAIELGTAHRVRPPVAIATWALALSDIGRGRWPEAMVRLEVVGAPHSPASHPMVALLAAGDLVETAYRLDRLDLAQTTLARFETFAGPTTAAWTRALVARCRALLAEGATAAGFFDEALLRNVFVKLGITSRAELIRFPKIDASTHASRGPRPAPARPPGTSAAGWAQ